MSRDRARCAAALLNLLPEIRALDGTDKIPTVTLIIAKMYVDEAVSSLGSAPDIVGPLNTLSAALGRLDITAYQAYNAIITCAKLITHRDGVQIENAVNSLCAALPPFN